MAGISIKYSRKICDAALSALIENIFHLYQSEVQLGDMLERGGADV